jgi:hypothetical protein
MTAAGGGLLLLLVALGALGCAPRKSVVVAQYFPHEVTVYVAVSARVGQSDRGNVAAMVDALEADLREGGSLVSILGARLDERPPVPRLEIQVRDSDSGEPVLRGAGQLTQLMSPLTGLALVGGGGGSMDVDAYIVDKDNVAHYVGHFESGSFGATTEVDVAAGDRVGHAIARRLQQ